MIGLIVAMSKNRVIGLDGKIPWKIKGEQKRFKELTTGNTVIMGRRSFEEIGKPLPDRDTIVISRTREFKGDHVKTAISLQEALAMVKVGDIYISGGGKLYEEALPIVDKMYVTVIDIETKGDTFFPEFKKEEFELVDKEWYDGDISYTYYNYVRKKK